MSDLIERLREFASDLHGEGSGTSRWSPFNPQADLVREAADRIASLEAALAAKEWRGTESAPRGEIVNVVGPYKHATAGYPRYAGFNEETGEWTEYSRHAPEPIVVWAWRPREDWPDETAALSSSKQKDGEE